MSGWFGQGKKRSPKPGISNDSLEKPGNNTPPLTRSGKMLLEGGGQGLHNPLAWDNMPSALQQKFPHWKDDTPLAVKTHSLSASEDGDQYSCYKTSYGGKMQPDFTFPYVVMENDTLNSIAVKFETTPTELARLNKKPLGLSSAIFTGEVLYVPDHDEIARSTPKSAPPSFNKSFPELPSSVESEGTLTNSSIGHVLETSSQGDEDQGRKEEGVISSTPPPPPSATTNRRMSEEVTDNHIVVYSKYISDDQGCIHGNLLVNRTVIIFTPNPDDTLVKEHGSACFEIMIPLQDVTFATFSKDINPPQMRRLATPVVSGKKMMEDGSPKKEGAEEEVDQVKSKEKDSGHLKEEEGEPNEEGDKAMKEERDKVVKEEGDKTVKDERGKAAKEEGDKAVKEVEDRAVKEEGDKAVKEVKNRAMKEEGDKAVKEVGKEVGDEEMKKGDVALTEQDGEESKGEEEAGKDLNEELKGKDIGMKEESADLEEEERTVCKLIETEKAQSLEESNNDQTHNSDQVPKGSLTGDKTNLSTVSKIKEELPHENSTDELLAIMGAEQPPTDSQLWGSSHTHTNSESSTDSLLSDQPCFLHIKVSNKSTAAHTYTPLNRPVGIDIPQNRPLLPKQGLVQVKTTFSFAVAEQRVSNIIMFMFKHHPSTPEELQNPLGSTSWHEGSYDFISLEGPYSNEDLQFTDNYFEGAESSESWEVFSLKDVSKYRPRIDRMEIEAFLPLPVLSEPSALMNDTHLRGLSNNLLSAAVGHDWYLIYSTFNHGISLRTLYRNMIATDLPESPVILLVRDEQLKLFGAAISSHLRMSEKFYGTGESFLFTFDESSSIKIYHWTGENNYIVKGSSDGIYVGCGDGHVGLWLDEGLLHGTSKTCTTFENECLSSATDFTCTGVEAWGFL